MAAGAGDDALHPEKTRKVLYSVLDLYMVAQVREHLNIDMEGGTELDNFAGHWRHWRGIANFEWE